MQAVEALRVNRSIKLGVVTGWARREKLLKTLQSELADTQGQLLEANKHLKKLKKQVKKATAEALKRDVAQAAGSGQPWDGFDEYDLNQDGKISREEFRVGRELQELRLMEQQRDAQIEALTQAAGTKGTVVNASMKTR